MMTRMQLSQSVQGVEVDVCIGSTLVRALVIPQAIEWHFHSGSSPAAWLRACNAYAELLHAVVLRHWQATSAEPIVLIARDFAAEPALADRRAWLLSNGRELAAA